MGEEADDYSALFLAKPARCTRSSRAGALCRANDHAISGGRGHGEGRVGGKDDDDGATIGRFQFIRLRQIVGGKIHREAPGIRIAHCGAVASGFVAIAGYRLVRIRPAALSSVRVYQLGEHIGVDCVVFAGKVSRLIVTPQLTKGERRNARDERRPIIAAPLLAYLPPVERERTARRRITAFRFERACVGTCGVAGRGDGNRSGLYVAGLFR